MLAPVQFAGGCVTGTVTVTLAEVVRLPDASTASAVRMCDPDEAAAAFHAALYGADVSADPMTAPSTRNVTEATPTLSAALAVIVTVFCTVAPFAGAVIATVGGVVSFTGGAVTVTVRAADVAVSPPTSRATAVSDYVPAGTPAQLAL